MEKIANLLGITYVMSKNPNEIEQTYNILNKTKDKLTDKIYDHIANDPVGKFRLNRRSLELLTLPTTTIDYETADFYTLDELNLLSILRKVAEDITITPEEFKRLQRFIGSHAKTQAIVESNGLNLDVDSLEKILEFTKSKTLPIGHNIRVFEFLHDYVKSKNVQPKTIQPEIGYPYTYKVS